MTTSAERAAAIEQKYRDQLLLLAESLGVVHQRLDKIENSLRRLDPTFVGLWDNFGLGPPDVDEETPSAVRI